MRIMEWAARRDHLGGVPRKIIFTAVGAFAKSVANLLNTTTVYNAETLLHLVRHRPPAVPLITVSNHMSTLDDPLMWGFKGFPIADADLGRWVLAAEDICFKNPLYSYCFRLGKCIPITRGGGIYQPHMDEALERLADGAWECDVVGLQRLGHQLIRQKLFNNGEECSRRCNNNNNNNIPRIFPTGWGLGGQLYADLTLVMPEKFMFGKKPPVPLCKKDISILIGEPLSFDVNKLKQKAIKMSRDLSYPHQGWPTTICGLDEAAQRYLYASISEQIRGAMERLRAMVTNRI
ncbi:phospholipid/glycerol acyltransferase family protein [Striga asiatica]|uniref:Tafazzin family protein n=1 Tax=Striga asiatica TaxID=4170 RepID=A0A5A7QNU0_STRAF|nr:phospholipid/glycerol acyltransferase family protein [Striga asiatica]